MVILEMSSFSSTQFTKQLQPSFQRFSSESLLLSQTLSIFFCEFVPKPNKSITMEVDSRVPSINIETAQKVIRQQLVLLLHAHSCQQKQKFDDESECNLPYCKATKEVLNHMRCCVEGSECTTDHCIAYQQIISHWKHCGQKKRCEICGPVFVSQINNALSAMNK